MIDDKIICSYCRQRFDTAAAAQAHLEEHLPIASRSVQERYGYPGIPSIENTVPIMPVAKHEGSASVTKSEPDFAAGYIVRCPDCRAIMFRLIKDVSLGDEITADQAVHADGRPCQDGDPLKCPECDFRFEDPSPYTEPPVDSNGH